MKISLQIPTVGTFECFRVADPTIVAVRDWICACGENNCVRSDQRIPGADDCSYYGAAYCASCKRGVGTLFVTGLSTIFGLEEDAAVLNGRARVYQ